MDNDWIVLVREWQIVFLLLFWSSISHSFSCESPSPGVHARTQDPTEGRFPSTYKSSIRAWVQTTRDLLHIDIQCFVTPNALCCDLHIATPQCVQSIFNIANYNRLENSSQPRNRESIKWDCTIVLQYIESHLISSRPLSRRTIVRCSLLAYPPLASPSFLSSWSCSGSVIVLLFWRMSLSSCCFCKGLDLLRRLVGPFDTGNKWSRPIQQPL